MDDRPLWRFLDAVAHGRTPDPGALGAVISLVLCQLFPKAPIARKPRGHKAPTPSTELCRVLLVAEIIEAVKEEGVTKKQAIEVVRAREKLGYDPVEYYCRRYDRTARAFHALACYQGAWIKDFLEKPDLSEAHIAAFLRCLALKGHLEDHP